MSHLFSSISPQKALQLVSFFKENGLKAALSGFWHGHTVIYIYKKTTCHFSASKPFFFWCHFAVVLDCGLRWFGVCVCPLSYENIVLLSKTVSFEASCLGTCGSFTYLFLQLLEVENKKANFQHEVHHDCGKPLEMTQYLKCFPFETCVIFIFILLVIHSSSTCFDSCVQFSLSVCYLFGWNSAGALCADYILQLCIKASSKWINVNRKCSKYTMNPVRHSLFLL